MGKSTLAGYLGNESHPDWQLAADDILAVKGSEQLLNALIQYPQLKYSAEDQPWLKFPESLPVSSIFVLEDLGKNGRDLVIQRLKTDMGTLALARYTVASVLFDPGLLDQPPRFLQPGISNNSNIKTNLSAQVGVLTRNQGNARI